MQDAVSKEAEEWKRKYHTEAKVNQELGRRLRDMKQKLEEERARADKLKMQIEAVDPASTVCNTSCTKCTTLEEEITKLRLLLTRYQVKVPEQLMETPEALVAELVKPVGESPQKERVQVLRRTSSILVRQQSGRIQCLRDILDNLTPRIDPETHRNSIPSSTLAAPPSPAAPVPVSRPKSFTKPAIPEINTDTSLGDLFKYTVVLTGPMPPKARRITFSSLSSRFKGIETRRASSEAFTLSKPGTSINNLRQPAIVTPANSANPQGPVQLTRTPSANSEHSSGEEGSRPRLATDGDKLQAPGSPMKKSGWLANIVPPRFRAASADAPPAPGVANKEASPFFPESPSKPTPSTCAQKPKLLSVCPPPPKGEVSELEGLLEICFPYGDKLPPLSDFSVANLRRTLQERHRTYRSPNSTFVLTISSTSSATDLTYAVCVHFPLFPEDDTTSAAFEGSDERLPTHGCICLLTPYPFFSLFFKVIFGIASIWESKRKEYVQDFSIATKEKKSPPPPLRMSDFIEHFEGIVKRLKEMRVPPMGGWTRLVLAPQHTPLSFHRPHTESLVAERRMLVLEYAAPMLFALLSVDQVLFLLGSLCCERKVLVVSDHANIVSSCVLALITLLEPLQWAGPVITLLPPRLDELLEAPVPLIAGRVSINSASIPNFSTLNKPMKGVIEMNMDQNNLCMHEEDLMCYHELKLPGCDSLVHELQHLSVLLFERHLDPDFPSIEQMQACETICSRIHRYMHSLCALATGESTSLDLVDGSLSILRDPKASLKPQQPSPADVASSRRFSEAVADYVRRFQETQMFSMFQLERHDEDHENIDDDDDDDGDDDDDEADESGDERNADELPSDDEEQQDESIETRDDEDKPSIHQTQ